MVNEAIHSGSTTHSSAAISQPPSHTTVKFPNLVDLDIIGSGKIKLEEIEFGRDCSNCQLRSLAMSCYNQIQFSCEWQLRLYNLQSLTLTHYYWWLELKFQCFKRLKVLEIIEPGCSILFSFSAFESLHQLERLEISSCDLLEEIVEDVRCEEPSGNYKKTVTFFHLYSVTLKDLPNLKKNFHGANYECHMPALVAVYVHNCGIPTLYTCSVITTMQKLDILSVKNCTLLEDIVEDARDDETSDTNDKIITLPRLTRVYLEDLPIVKSFSTTSSYSFNMPELHEFHLQMCPQIEKFTSLKTSNGTVRVHSDWHPYTYQKDLNDYITKMRKAEDKRLGKRAGESSYSNKKLGTEAERVGEEKPQETEENDQQ
ncbi:hypothetical protein POM88_021598 [Heracleum sosnowskyi]|uniref:Disease resistance protein At4g27190-like leucine-rich repeats domain-containing protein n=1 Tax=Heracleum sosnowskyi TaxID=360622 RepID=A0AAD8IG65_9APIA|nr:hypothetical protein POM88_021598 [Heracleum sosnowskyi]